MQATPPPLLALEGMGKRFGSLQALQDVSMALAPGEVHCLLGENGAGKSTLCNLIFGVYQADEGRMQLHGAPYAPAGPADALAQRVAMVHQHFSLVPDLSVVDNLLLGQSRGVLRRGECAERIAGLSRRYGLALEPYARVQDLSVGERQRVEIVKCLMREPRLLVLDEPTAVLLPDEIAALLTVCRRVADEGCGVMLVTHKLAEIQQVAQRATVLRGGRIAARSEHPARELNDLVRAMIGRDASHLHAPAVAASVGLEDPAELAAAPASAATRAPTPPAVEPALTVDGLTVRDADGVTRLDNFTLMVAPGEIVAVAGVEGNGQSELAAVLSGLLPATLGRFFVAGRELTEESPRSITAAGAGIVPEDRHAVGCVLGLTVAENLLLDRLPRFKRWGLLDRVAMRREALALMQRFDVRAAGPDVTFAGLSGGNQQKAVLGRELTIDKLRFLLAAQPTRGLDVGAVDAVYGHIRKACAEGVGVLLISSELDELIRVADRVVVLYRGRVMGECPATPAQRERIGAWMAGQDSPATATTTTTRAEAA
ncbi:MAG: ABC transporter ATP-binding protein [Pseudomonadota bacterium]